MIISRMTIITTIGLLVVTSISGCDIFSVRESEDIGEVLERRELPRELEEAEIQLVDASGRFGFELLQRIAEMDPEENHVISPLSIILAYGMLLNGAENDTYEQIRDVFYLSEMSRDQVNESAESLIELLTTFDDHVTFNIANSIWYRDTYVIEDEFLQTNRRFFDAVIEAADFDDPETVEHINAWVREKTEGLIDDVVEPPIDPLTIMFLINAIYFNGEWTVPFDPELTERKPFYRSDGTVPEVEMMRLEDMEDMQYGQGVNYEVVNLPYGDAGFAMTLVLPDEDTGLQQWLHEMDWEQWEDLTRNMQSVILDLEMPKFELEYEVEDFKNLLEEMGIVDAFDPYLSDFSRIYTRRDDLYISDTKHKTYIRVDEEGTEAAAVTSIEIRVTSAPQRVHMRFDRPWFFVIREVESNTPLFMGAMTDPAAR